MHTHTHSAQFPGVMRRLAAEGLTTTPPTPKHATEQQEHKHPLKYILQFNRILYIHSSVNFDILQTHCLNEVFFTHSLFPNAAYYVTAQLKT